MDVYVVLYKNFTSLDAFGPVEVLSRIEELRIKFVSLYGGKVTNTQSLQIETAPLTAIRRDGILVVPGGFGSREVIKDETFIKALTEAGEKSRYVLSVCTGAALVAQTGLLDGCKATTNKKAFSWVAGQRSSVKWDKEARWVSAGKCYTSAGVSAGIDMALGFVQDVFGADQAERISTEMEYHRHRTAVNDSFGV